MSPAPLRRFTLVLSGVGVLAGMGTTLRAQVSPGPLARAHQSLEGALKCTSCHGGGKAGMSSRCSACHKDIGQLTEQRKGYHGSSTVRDTPCAACHPDHAGESFGMIKWPGGGQVRFDHRQAGWALEQSHDSLACEKCHASQYRTAPVAALSVRKRGAGWIGLGTACASCHADPHRNALGTGCTECHDASSWGATPTFSHDSTTYPLTERHLEVKCAECHESPRVATARTAQGAVIPVFKPLQYGACSNCHTDPHGGQLGPKCAECHTTAGFKTVEKGRFNHDRTRYRLAGRHAAVSCAACHGKFATAAEKRPPSLSCASCHRDAHNGTATLGGRAADCGACHTLAGFAAGTTTVAQHARTKYPLEGRHASVTCARCHRRDLGGKARWGSSAVVLRPAAARCEDCHTDSHGAQLAGHTPRPGCVDCHVVAGWAPGTFGPAAHARLRLPLEGRHAEATCRTCHAKDRKGLPPLPARAPSDRVGFVFRIPEVTCTACHQDPHGGRIASDSPRVQKEGCLACHDTRAFRPSSAGPAAHAEFGFTIDGAHGATPCVGCHAEMKAAPQARRSSLVAAAALPAIGFGAKRECAACHKTVHGTQFSNRSDGGRCDACHDAGGFAPASRFDHTRDASFSTKGAHAAVPCAKCHSPDPSSSDRRSLIYRPVSAKCESCHAVSEAK